MFNPFRIFTLAADARRALVSLDAEEFSRQTTLTSKVNVALNRLAASRNHNFEKRQQILTLEGKLAEANAKIERMTSGLKRGAKKAA